MNLRRSAHCPQRDPLPVFPVPDPLPPESDVPLPEVPEPVPLLGVPVPPPDPLPGPLPFPGLLLGVSWQLQPARAKTIAAAAMKVVRMNVLLGPKAALGLMAII